MRQVGDAWWLGYAHTHGDDREGSVGLAVTSDPLQVPQYVADLTAPSSVGALTFLRSVEITSDGVILATDTSIETGGAYGRVIKAPLPDLPVTGATGEAARDQVFVDLPGATELLGQLEAPFEAFVWTTTFAF